MERDESDINNMITLIQQQFDAFGIEVSTCFPISKRLIQRPVCYCTYSIPVIDLIFLCC